MDSFRSIKTSFLIKQTIVLEPESLTYDIKYIFLIIFAEIITVDVKTACGFCKASYKSSQMEPQG